MDPIPVATRRLRPLRDRATLVARQDHLVAAIAAVEVEQRRLGREAIALRRELAFVHERLWPATVGHAFRSDRRPRVPGPAPIPRPIDGAQPLVGATLRRAALAVLVRAATPLSLTEIHRTLHLSGYRLTSAHPVKQLANALGYEERRSRVRRTARGTYTIGELTPARRRALVGSGAR